MAARVKLDAGEAKFKHRYRVTNWAEYDLALVNRGSFTVWFDCETVREGWTPPRPAGRGKPGQYSDLAIQTLLTLKTSFRLPYRATEGLARSLMQLAGLDLPVPDHTHLSRRAATLAVKIPRRLRKGPIHVVVDSTGLKIFGEGEWKVRQQGVGKWRTWRKIHLAMDETTKDILGIEVTTAEWGGSEVVDGLLEQIPEPIGQFSGDEGTHARVAQRGARRRFHRARAPYPGGVTSIRATAFWQPSSATAKPPGRNNRATSAVPSPRT